VVVLVAFSVSISVLVDAVTVVYDETAFAVSTKVVVHISE
jgi:hypothetical protein